MVSTELLRKFSLFTELDESQLQKIAVHVQGRRYPEGSAICSKGERGDEIFFVMRGEVSVVLPLYRYDRKLETISKI